MDDGVNGVTSIIESPFFIKSLSPGKPSAKLANLIIATDKVPMKGLESSADFKQNSPEFVFTAIFLLF